MFLNVFHVLRIVFVLLLAGVAVRFMDSPARPDWLPINLVIPSFLVFGIIVVTIDIMIPGKSLAALSGVFFGLLVGMFGAYGLSLVVDMVMAATPAPPEMLVKTVKLSMGIICCYFSISFIIQTKDDIRFIIPYVEFTKQKKGGRPILLDTSVIIDGRISDIAETRLFESEIILPRFVLHELQMVADSADKLKRNRGRRGLDILNKLQSNPKIDVRVLDVEFSADIEKEGVDQKLVSLAQQLDGRVMTNDYNLNKVAQLRGIGVININDLANALKPVFLPGERLNIRVIKPGEESDQGIGYLEDGTMVVIAGGREHIGDEVACTVTSVLQTSAGRMVFGRTDHSNSERRRSR
jgi:uncharacterized protein YacL